MKHHENGTHANHLISGKQEPNNIRSEEQSAHGGHHEGMEQEFRLHFIVCAVLTIPVLLLSPVIQQWLGFSFTFPGKIFLLWGLASVIAIGGAWPFYRGAAQAIPHGILDMNVLVSVAVAAGYLFSTAATFIISAPEFYWEISTLVVFLLFTIHSPNPKEQAWAARYYYPRDILLLRTHDATVIVHLLPSTSL